MERPRHVRDMWRIAHNQTTFWITELAIGALAVVRRRYTLGGERITIPGHIGIITDKENGLNMIHANPRTGKVEEEPLRNLNAVMGYIAVNLFDTKERHL